MSIRLSLLFFLTLISDFFANCVSSLLQYYRPDTLEVVRRPLLFYGLLPVFGWFSIIMLLFCVFGWSFMQEWIVHFTVSYWILLHFYMFFFFCWFYFSWLYLGKYERKVIYKNILCVNVYVWIQPDLTGSPYRNSVPSYFFSVGASYSNYYASFSTIWTQHLHLNLNFAFAFASVADSSIILKNIFYFLIQVHFRSVIRQI